MALLKLFDHPSPLPMGFRFYPTDQQLLQYLYRKISGQPYFEGVVFDCDLYGGNEPWEIWNDYKGIDGEDLYFFTKLKRSTTKCGELSTHINRKIGLSKGTWSGENKAKPIFANESDGEIYGYIKRFRYENKSVPEHNGEWIMHEYSLHQTLIRNDDPNNYVLCRIRKNERPKRKDEKICMQLTRKRITVDDPRMSKNETSYCYSELQPIEQQAALEMVDTYQGNSDIFCGYEMTFDKPTDQTFSTFEMTNDQSTDQRRLALQMTNDLSADQRFVPLEMTNDESTDQRSVTLEMTNDKNISYNQDSNYVLDTDNEE